MQTYSIVQSDSSLSGNKRRVSTEPRTAGQRKMSDIQELATLEPEQWLSSEVISQVLQFRAPSHCLLFLSLSLSNLLSKLAEIWLGRKAFSLQGSDFVTQTKGDRGCLSVTTGGGKFIYEWWLISSSFRRRSSPWLMRLDSKTSSPIWKKSQFYSLLSTTTWIKIRLSSSIKSG